MMQHPQRVEFKTLDGVKLRGDFYQAEGDGRPVVVMATGFGLVKEMSAGFAKQFQSAGMSALAYDYRSFGSSDGLPRQEIDLYEQASDFHDAVTAAADLPNVDPSKIVMWGAGHGGSVAMIAGGQDPRLKAVVIHGPFPSGKLDAEHFPTGALEEAWRERERRTRLGQTEHGYATVWRDWQADGEGDENSVFIRGQAAHFFVCNHKAIAAAAGTPWENKVTLQSFLNIAGTEARDHVAKITLPTLYMVFETDPFCPAPDIHRDVFSRMGPNAEFKVIAEDPGQTPADKRVAAASAQVSWLQGVLDR